MNKYLVLLLSVSLSFFACAFSSSQTEQPETEKEEPAISQEINPVPENVQRFLRAYPESISGYENDSLVLIDGSKVAYQDTVFNSPYLKGELPSPPEKGYNPGRIRNEELLKKMYGSSAAEVGKHLVNLTWCPGLVNQKLRVTSINGVDKQLKRVSDELDKHPEWKQYLRSAGTFNWRVISGTSRLSAHSFGIAIDLDVKYSNYWQWDCRCKDESVEISYKNRIPQGIVDIFEAHGFVWGGKWYLYDTMHFEYRPELIERD